MAVRISKEGLVALGLAALTLAGVGTWLYHVFSSGEMAGPKPGPNPGPNPGPAPSAFVTLIDLKKAPIDVQEAAAQLQSSNVGYAMVKPDKTYLIISTGEAGPAITVERADAQVTGDPTDFVDLFLKGHASGDRLLVGTTPLTHAAVHQFTLDGVPAAIPTLFNYHKLPLVHLDESTGFSVLSPTPAMLVVGNSLHVEGYARAFEAQFLVTVMTEDGRELGRVPVMAAAGGPNWGSFTADLHLETSDLPDKGYVLFEGIGKERLQVPVRFEKPAQLG